VKTIIIYLPVSIGGEKMSENLRVYRHLLFVMLLALGGGQVFAGPVVVVVPMFGDDAAAKWLGLWTDNTAYQKGDIVRFDGSSYIALINHTAGVNNTPELDDTTWGMVASVGDQGLEGDQGPKGDTGSQGMIGPVGAQGPQGIQGAKGDKGDRGVAGDPGLACWDLNGNGTADLPDEDYNSNGIVDVDDCKGEQTINLTVDFAATPGLVAQDFVGLFPDAASSTARVEIQGVCTARFVIVNGPTTEIQLIPGFDKYGHPNNQSGLALELPRVIETNPSTYVNVAGDCENELRSWLANHV